MVNGIINSSTGRFLPLASRSQLRDDGEAQALLKLHHYNSSLICGCGFGQASPLRLIPVEREDGKFTLSRQNIDDHTSECFLWLEGDDQERVKKRSPGIFAPIKPAAGHVPSREAKVTSRIHYEEFGRYARGILSRGLSRAFISRNNRADRWSNPTTAEVMRAIGAAVTEFPFGTSDDGYALAARMRCTLGFGIVTDPLNEEDSTFPLLNAYRWSGDRFAVQLTGVHSAAFAPAVRTLRTISGHRTSPYFFLGVQDADGWIQRLFLHQIAVEESFLLPSDSGAECVRATALAHAGQATLKPVLVEDLAPVLDAFQISLGCDLSQFPRPDYLIFGGTPDRPTLRIEELRGYTIGEDPNYDTSLETKHAFYQELRANIPLKSAIEDGTRFRWQSHAHRPEQWAGTALTLAAPSNKLF